MKTETSSVLLLEEMMINHHLIASFTNVYLEFFQLVLNINCQGWIHGLILVDKVLESVRKRKS